MAEHTHTHTTPGIRACAHAHTHLDTRICDAYGRTHSDTLTHTYTQLASRIIKKKFQSLFADRLHSGMRRAKVREQDLTDYQVTQLCRCRENEANFFPVLIPEIVH